MDSTSGDTEASTSTAVDGLNTIIVIGGEGECIVELHANKATRMLNENIVSCCSDINRLPWTLPIARPVQAIWNVSEAVLVIKNAAIP